MSSRNGDVKRHLIRGLSSKKHAGLDTAAHNLLTRTLRKQSDKYKSRGKNSTMEGSSDEQFVIHKSTRPEDYKIFSSEHAIRESKLQAFEKSEQAFEELFNRNGFMDESGSEDEEPDLSAFVPPSEVIDDDILISVPGYSKEEITACKRLRINDRKNVRLSRVSELERAFSNTGFLKTMGPDRLQEYNEINQEFISSLRNTLEQKRLLEQPNNGIPEDPEDPEDVAGHVRFETYEFEDLRDLVSQLEKTAWMYKKR